MEGNLLKEGKLEKLEINQENMEVLFKYFLKGKKTNTYKFFLFKILLENADKGITETSINSVIEKFIEKYWNYYSVDKTEYLKEKSKSELFKDIVDSGFKTYEELTDVKKVYILKKNQRVLKKYVFGALYGDMNGHLYGFSKKENCLNLNPSFIHYIKENKVKGVYVEKIRRELQNFLSKQKLIKEFVRRKEMVYYQQQFSFEMTFVYRILENIEKLKGSKFEVAQDLGLGIPKLDALLQYLRIGDLITEKNERTLLGEKVLKMKLNSDFVEPLIYYNLVRNPESGGHYVFGSLANDVLYDYSVINFVEKITKKEIVDKAKNSNIKSLGKWNEMIGHVYKALTDSETGFGKMGIVEKIDKSGKDEVVEVHSYWVEPLVGAYIIYDMWKDGQTSMGISNIISDKYNLGRMFLMDSEAVEETLQDIRALGYIDIEKVSGLNQIRIKKNISKKDILDHIIREA